MAYKLYSIESRKGGVGKTTVARVRICPREGKYGIQVPKGKWHSIEVYEPSTIFEAKDGAYGK